MTDQPQLTWREPNTPLAELAPGQIAYCEPPADQTGGTWVVLRGFDGMGKGPVRLDGGALEDGQLHLSTRRS